MCAKFTIRGIKSSSTVGIMISPTEELCWRTRGWVVPTHVLEIEDQLIHDIEHTYKGKEIPDDFGTETKLTVGNCDVIPIIISS